METIHLGLSLLLCLGVSSETLKRQKRNWIIDSFSIDEGYSGVFPYVLDSIKIQNELTLYKISGQGVDRDPKGLLEIDNHTGQITVHRPVDFEEHQVLQLDFQAIDRESHIIDTQLGVEILIIDANDNPPLFERDVYHFNLTEATSQGTEEIKIMATDKDKSKKFNSFDLQIVSVHPEPFDLEFDLTQHFQIGTISFKGCLDHERAEKYTIIVEAKDHGEQKQLSSSCIVIIHIEDGNNHLPVITGHTGSGRVKEGEENVLVNRLQVTDKDSEGTAAWRAEYQIQGDTGNNFRISTDRVTNEGLLYLNKPLDYEDGPLKNLTISVENKIPYRLCRVVHRSAAGLWEVTVGGGETETREVTVTVEDVNEPPVFDPPKKRVTQRENVEVGKYLATFTARDPDVAGANALVYKKRDDPADWVAVDAETGKITTTKLIDRESTFVKDNVYTVTLWAVDDGQPPMTGTATLDIVITDENDNAPFLAQSAVDVCQSHGVSLANVTAVDLDEEPYGGPFNFRLQDKEKGKWKLDPAQGFSVNLVKEPAVHSGDYELLLEVSDLQGTRATHNLRVTVCRCGDAARPNCRVRKAASSSFGGGALVVVLFATLLLAGVLLLAFMVSCKKKSKAIANDDTHQYLMKSNIEKPGTDCKVWTLNQEYSQFPAKQFNNSTAVSNAKTEHDLSAKLSTGSTMEGNFVRASSFLSSTRASSRMTNQHRNSMHWPMGASAAMSNLHRSSMHKTWIGRSASSANRENVTDDAMLLNMLNMLNKTLSNHEAAEEELGDYAPRVYAEEGGASTDSELDAISIPDVSFDADLDADQASKFNTLASICMPGGL
ncbi:cadherin-13-like [Cyclopterus lumpus]|uniref:Cadherin domain-containing protein n=1 Tax=Cyclopterus lumpus TaxID=8103 RepID=A0A8C3G5R2_CYCLU|nr:cadherin-13-like [Cyclopterus lumpus]